MYPGSVSLSSFTGQQHSLTRVKPPTCTCDIHTFLVEADCQAEGRVPGLVLQQDAGFAILQQLHYGEGLALGAVLTRVVKGGAAHPVRGVDLHIDIKKWLTNTRSSNNNIWQSSHDGSNIR